jgi:hypothetical protein
MTQASGAPRQGKTAETGTEDEGKEELAERLPTGAAGRALRHVQSRGPSLKKLKLVKLCTHATGYTNAEWAKEGDTKVRC